MIKTRMSQFWVMQVGFWAFLCIISLFTLTLWYAQLNFIYVGHTLLQGIVGFIVSIPLYKVFMNVWNKPASIRLSVGFIWIMLAAAIWTAIRIETYMFMTGEGGVWRDFGGWYFGSIFIFLCWVSIFHGLRYYQLLEEEHRIMLRAEAEAREEQLKRLTAQSVARDAKIKMLRYQLNPHFLCNTLNAINSLIEVEASEQAQKMTVQLSKFLRYSLDNNPDTKLPLDKELNALKLYLEIEKTRFGDRLKLDFTVSDESKSALVPSLLIQPIIENSMKHVIAQNEEGGTISLRSFIQNDKLVLEVSDTGAGPEVGRSTSKSKVDFKQSRGVGLRNIDERLKVIYDNNYKFELETKSSGGLTTIITIPYEPSA